MSSDGVSAVTVTRDDGNADQQMPLDRAATEKLKQVAVKSPDSGSMRHHQSLLHRQVLLRPESIYIPTHHGDQ